MAEYFFSLKERREVAHGTMAFWWDTTGTGFSFKAGQSADITLLNPPFSDEKGNLRAFSIASSPHHADFVMTATRMRDSAFKNSLRTIPLGTRIKASAAMGSFTLHQDSSRPAVFLIGGIGITPVHSMIEFATHEKLPHHLYLFYSNKNAPETAFLKDFEQWARENNKFHFFPTITQPDSAPWRYSAGRINAPLLEQNVAKLRKAIFYSSGPAEMVAGMRKILAELNINEDNVKTEEFSGY